MKKVIIVTCSSEYLNWSCIENYKNASVEYNHEKLTYQLFKLRLEAMNDEGIKEFNQKIKLPGFVDLKAVDIDDDNSICDYLNSKNKGGISLFEKYYTNRWVDIKLYDSYISTDLDIEVVFVYWNNIPESESPADCSKNRLKLIDAIVKDCGVEQNGINQLYIHDKEWGKVTRDAVLIKDRKRNKAECQYIDKNEATELIKTFNYIVTFRHVGTTNNSTIFDKIKRFDFDMGSTVTIKCAEIDNKAGAKGGFKDAYNKLNEI